MELPHLPLQHFAGTLSGLGADALLHQLQGDEHRRERLSQLMSERQDECILLPITLLQRRLLLTDRSDLVGDRQDPVSAREWRGCDLVDPPANRQLKHHRLTGRSASVEGAHLVRGLLPEHLSESPSGEREGVEAYVRQPATRRVDIAEIMIEDVDRSAGHVADCVH